MIEPGTSVDPLKSKAFMPIVYDFGIYVKEPDAKREILEILSRYSDYILAIPYDELYPGPYSSLGPDIAVIPKTEKGVWITERVLPLELIDRSSIYGHDYRGIFIARLYDIQLEDVKVVKNYEAGVIAMCALGIPLPHEVSIPHYLRGQCNDRERRNYVSRWQLIVRLAKSRAIASRAP